MSNPSMLLTLKGYWERGLMSEKEYMIKKGKYLGINVYTGKAKSETIQTKNHVHSLLD